jgi:hypothetical protein
MGGQVATARPKRASDFDYVFSKCAKIVKNHDAERAELNRGTVVEFTPPLLLEIASYLIDSPKDHVRFCNMTSSFLAAQMQPFSGGLWNALYRQKWAPLHEWMSYQGCKDWRSLYQKTFMGETECVLEVFDREKKPGFAMAAMAAKMQYDRNLDAYVAKYISASEVLPEVVPLNEKHRLRFCPLSARPRLRPGMPAPPMTEGPTGNKVSDLVYPYKVLEGADGLVVGQGVELQWKMQLRSPFGWWFGNLESLQKERDGKLYSATITFRHFPSTSRWYRLVVKFGDSEMRACTFGGYTGGVRAVSKTEQERWVTYLPKAPVDL